MEKVKVKLFPTVKSYSVITLGLTVQTLGVYFFKIPNGFVSGGVSGVGTVLGKISNVFSAEVWIALLNISLLLIGFIFLGKETGIKTVYGSIMFSILTF
ncbi:MAG: YitT family protein, partial [Clostridia bacterium]|nr:YitT family protein [Clostridia bacterium]